MPRLTKEYNLKRINPKLSTEWHPTKNDNLTPEKVTPNSVTKVWWICSKKHEWESTVNRRNQSKGCPYCSSRKVCEDNCLQTLNPDLAKEWHPSKNGSLTPRDITPNSNRKVWWICSEGHEWESTVNNRNKGKDCPYCSGKKVCEDNCLQTVNPNLAKEWHPNKNEKLSPRDVTPYSHKKVWWICSKGHGWEATVSKRSNGNNCPFCSGQKVCEDNCLQTINPSLAKEWHPNKNGSLSPRDVTRGSIKRVWWICSKGHEWSDTTNHRSRGIGCPYCSGRKVCEDNCLQTLNPVLAKEWHPSKNGNLTPKDVTPGSDKMVWWQCKRGHEWKSFVYNRNKGIGCPNCNSQTSQAEIRIFTEMKSLFRNVAHRKKIFGVECDIYLPDFRIAIEVDGRYWHKDKFDKDFHKTHFLKDKGIKLIRVRASGLEKITPDDIFFSESKFNFSTIKSIGRKLLEQKFLSKSLRSKIEMYISKGKFLNNREYVNLLYMLPSPFAGCSLFDLNKELSKEWHPSKNGNLTPKDVTPGSGKKVWWQCKKGHEWEATVSNRNNGRGCPYCLGKKVCEDNCLQIKNPILSKEWHPSKNGNLTPKDVTPGSGKKVWWQCKRGHEWEATISSRNNGNNCPFCSGQKVCEDNCLKTLNPDLAKEWHPNKNGNLTPRDVTTGSGKKVWWICDKEHEWETTISSRNSGCGCPYCSGRRN